MLFVGSVVLLFVVQNVKAHLCRVLAVSFRLTGMPKEKYDPPDPRRCYTIMPADEVASGKKSHWSELEISGQSHSLPLGPLPLKIK